MSGLTTEEAAEAVAAAMSGHVHGLVPVVSLDELVASLCRTCWQQLSPDAWIRQGDAIQAAHERQQRIDACGEHDRDEIEVVTWGSAERQTMQGPCRRCGG